MFPALAFCKFKLGMYLWVCYLLLHENNVRLLRDFGSPKECKRTRHQKGVSIFLFGPFRHLSDFVVHVIKAKRKQCYFIRFSFLQANESKEQIFRYLLRVFTELLKAKLIQSGLEKHKHVRRLLFWVCALQGTLLEMLHLLESWVVCLLKHGSYCPCNSILLVYMHWDKNICIGAFFSFLMSEIDSKFNY